MYRQIQTARADCGSYFQGPKTHGHVSEDASSCEPRDGVEKFCGIIRPQPSQPNQAFKLVTFTPKSFGQMVIGPFKTPISHWLTRLAGLHNYSPARKLIQMNLNLGGTCSTFSVTHVSYRLNHLATFDNQKVIRHLVVHYIPLYTVYTVFVS